MHFFCALAIFNSLNEITAKLVEIGVFLEIIGLKSKINAQIICPISGQINHKGSLFKRLGKYFMKC